MRWNEIIGGLGFAVVTVLFAQACTATTTEGSVTATNRSTGEIREFDSEADVPDGWVACDGDDCPDPYACLEIDEAACLVRADCAPLYDVSGAFTSCTEGGVGTCTQASCGEVPPGMPAILCWDGSVGGSTGRCIEQESGDCGWEIRECPPEPQDCQPQDCPDPAPGMPNYECEDGSIGGPACVPTEDGTCGWAILDCPEDGTCDDIEKCGPPLGMPAILCDDGTVGGNTGRCLDHGDGTCGWEIRECPDEE